MTLLERGPCLKRPCDYQQRCPAAFPGWYPPGASRWDLFIFLKAYVLLFLLAHLTNRQQTIVSSSHLSVIHNEKIFHEPYKFKPERWLGEEGKELERWHVGFSRGPRRCIGSRSVSPNVLSRGANLMLCSTTTKDIVVLHTWSFFVSPPTYFRGLK